MGWFWADAPAAPAQSMPPSHAAFDGKTPPPGCPMHQKSADALNATPKPAPSASASCPIDHSKATPTTTPPPSSCPIDHSKPAQEPSESKSFLSQINPLNYMFKEISQKPAENQSIALPTSRDPSTIPKGTGDGNWEYPSPQQMYNALLRKGYTDTDITAVEAMVACHNFLNEGAWHEIIGWEDRFSQGLYRGLKVCSRGEENASEMAYKESTGREVPPTLIRFQGRPKDMSPKATMMQVMGWLYPSKYASEPPFDRHDWYVSRKVGDQTQEVRYVIDYYGGGETDENGDPVFFLDVRPAFTVTGAAERAIRWGSDVWWRASGGEVRELERMVQEHQQRLQS